MIVKFNDVFVICRFPLGFVEILFFLHKRFVDMHHLISVQDKSVFHVLIVDDEITNRIILKNILDEIGCRVNEAENGIEALAFIEKTKPDMVLLDVMMPEMDGFEVCRRLKADSDLQEIPVIFITALMDSDDIVTGFDVGAVDYLTKPFYLSEVKARVLTQLNLKAATDKIKRYNEELEKIIAEESKELVKAERQAAFGQLAQGIVHNLKGPLTAIRGAVQLAKKNLRQIEMSSQEFSLEKIATLNSLVQGTGKTIDVIETSSNRLNDMVTRMMARSSSDQSIDMEEVDLNVIVQEEIDFLQADLDFKHNLKKEVSFFPGKLIIHAVPREISQVFNNLLMNAIDALHDRPSPAVCIETRHDGLYGVLRVSDNGIGIAGENKEKVFDPFFTTKKKATSKGDQSEEPVGTGLGLYLCMRAIRSLDGDILIDSEEGKGTTVEVRVPLSGNNA